MTTTERVREIAEGYRNAPCFSELLGESGGCGCPVCGIRKILTLVESEKLKGYDPNFGDDRVCDCGHPYYRHFDSYDDMSAVGCKYCPCLTWREPQATTVSDEPWRGASEPCDACGAPAGVACPKPSDACRAICSCPTCTEPEPTTGRDEAIREVNGGYDDLDARYVVVDADGEVCCDYLLNHDDARTWVEGLVVRLGESQRERFRILPVGPEPRVEPVSRTPIADALHEAYMAGFNDAGTEQDALDADAFTEAGVALSRMFASPPPSGEPTEAEASRDLREAYSRYLQTVDGAPRGDLFRTIERIVGWGTNASNPTESEGVETDACVYCGHPKSEHGWSDERGYGWCHGGGEFCACSHYSTPTESREGEEGR